METAVRQCFAYNIKGERCDHPAGHPGDHAITYAWTDDECAAPSLSSKAPAPAAPQMPEMPPIPEAIPVQTGCIACSHKHKGGECKCGCYEFIG